MEIEMRMDSENKLFGRREISFTASYSGKTPSREEIKEEICRKLSLNPDLTHIIRIAQSYGSMSSEVTAYSYSSRENYEKLAKQEAKKKEKKAKEKKAGAGVGASQASEKREEKKEETKEESKEGAK